MTSILYRRLKYEIQTHDFVVYLVRSISTRRWLRVLGGALICNLNNHSFLWILWHHKYLCHKTTLVVGAVGDGLNTAIGEVHLVAALHLT